MLRGHDLYNALYRVGYHQDTNLTHSGLLVDAIVRSSNVSSVLDYGCSHGLAVSALWGHNIYASGYDISPVAVGLAEATRTRNRRCVDELGFCFSSKLPAVFLRPVVDAVLCTDVLEHIELTDVNRTLALLASAARYKMYLKIASAVERNKQSLHKLDAHKRPRDLHATVRSFAWWSTQLARHGFVQIRMLRGDTAVFRRSSGEL